MPPVFRALPLNAIKPAGWLKKQLNQDLSEGFAPVLNRLSVHASHDLFRYRISSSQEQFAWWDSETRGNWLWGYVIMAFLAQNSEHIERVSQLLGDLKNTQDSDGYIGIYSPEWRYNHPPDENGELWGQSRALLPMLSYYELSGDSSFLSAVEKATRLTMQHYNPRSPYFRVSTNKKTNLTGLTHGLSYVDVVEWLYRITGDKDYRDYGVWLYEDFNRMPLPFQNDDLAVANLLDTKHFWQGHAVHTAEHLRALVWAAVISGQASYQKALEVAFTRLNYYLLPSGTLLGDERIHGMPTPDIGYEYCTMTELLLSLSFAQEKLGQAVFGDMVETLAFNAGQRARLSNGQGVAYLSSDTRRAALATQPDSFSYLQNSAGRFKYSPTHEDVACCCNPNSIRFLSHFVSRMWFSCEDGLAAVTYGPGKVTSRIGEIEVEIVEETDYPFSDQITFIVNPARAIEFTLYLRKPEWCAEFQLECEGAVVDKEDKYILLRKMWQPGNTVKIIFNRSITLKPYPNGEYSVFYGPLQFALPIESKFEVLKDYPVSNFHDYNVWPLKLEEAYQPIFLDARLPDYGLRVENLPANETGTGWEAANIRLYSLSHELIPLGSTILRLSSFPVIH